MSKVTEAEKWFGKKKKDLTQEEQKVFYKLKSKTLQHQLNQQKAMWNELKKQVFDYCPLSSLPSLDYADGYHNAIKKIYKTIQELEKGEKE